MEKVILISPSLAMEKVCGSMLSKQTVLLLSTQRGNGVRCCLSHYPPDQTGKEESSPVVIYILIVTFRKQGMNEWKQENEAGKTNRLLCTLSAYIGNYSICICPGRESAF